jgi:two-component system KDP operon response regulator KdpE
VGESDPVVTASLLDAGAADVVTLATGSAELIARLRSLMRSRRRRLRGHTGEGTIRTGGIAIDRIAQIVTKHGVRVTLSTAEYRLVDALASRIDQITPYRVLLSTVWGEAYVDDAHYLRIYISYLRSKLEDDPARPVYIVHEQGAGYRLAKRPLWTEG